GGRGRDTRRHAARHPAPHRYRLGPRRRGPDRSGRPAGGGRARVPPPARTAPQCGARLRARPRRQWPDGRATGRAGLRALPGAGRHGAPVPLSAGRGAGPLRPPLAGPAGRAPAHERRPPLPVGGGTGRATPVLHRPLDRAGRHARPSSHPAGLGGDPPGLRRPRGPERPPQRRRACGLGASPRRRLGPTPARTCPSRRRPARPPGRRRPARGDGRAPGRSAPPGPRTPQRRGAPGLRQYRGGRPGSRHRGLARGRSRQPANVLHPARRTAARHGGGRGLAPPRRPLGQGRRGRRPPPPRLGGHRPL
ncbi:MAG: Succinyl-CoA synthetase, alpha subunit, partial [uncultured Rubellimicrobium sp.]